MKTSSNGKTLYIAISDNKAIRIRAYSKPKATVVAAMYFTKNIKGWAPQHGGIVDKAHTKEMRQYISEHTDLEWLEGGAPIDG